MACAVHEVTNHPKEGKLLSKKLISKLYHFETSALHCVFLYLSRKCETTVFFYEEYKMGLMLALFHIMCVAVISVKAEQPGKGQIDQLQYDLPLRANTFAPSGDGNAHNGCSCVKKTCSCCAHLHVPHVIDEAACANISYVSADLGLRLQLILDGRVIYSGEISVRNPPPICIGIPYVKKYAKICLDLYNITWKKHIGGCAKIQVKLLFVIKKDFDLGCFNFNDLDDESKQGVSRILLGLKMHRMMMDAIKEQYQKKIIMV